jgi:hypothetical protein
MLWFLLMTSGRQPALTLGACVLTLWTTSATDVHPWATTVEGRRGYPRTTRAVHAGDHNGAPHDRLAEAAFSTAFPTSLPRWFGMDPLRSKGATTGWFTGQPAGAGGDPGRGQTT